MKNYNGATMDTTIFLHIPKTAGTTLHYVIGRNYPPPTIYTDQFTEKVARDRFATLSPEQKQNIHLLWGHFPFGIHTQLPTNYTYFTLLRDPVERVLSHYHFVRSRPHEFPPHERWAAEKMSLHDILAERLIVDIENVQTRLLAGLPYLFPADEYTEAHLETAKRNLHEYFAVVGLVEQFDASLLLLKRSFGWRTIYYAKHNVGREREPISAETRALIEQQNSFDVRLYEFGKELFAEQVARQGEDFSAELHRFQRLNNLIYSPILATYWGLRRIPFRTLLKQRIIKP